MWTKIILVILVFFMSHIALPDICTAHDDAYKAVAPILSSAENFFISLKKNEFDATWDLLSEHSRKVIISEVYEVTRKINGDISREDIVKDFNSRGTMFTNYWNSFHRSFDADMILERSEWEIGFIRNDTAELIITYNDSQGPTVLKMSKEQDTWRVGLTETFWQRKALNLLHFIFQ